MSNNNKSYNDIWHNCLITMRNQLTSEEFNRWLKPVVPLEFDGNVLKLRVPSKEYAVQIENNFMIKLRPIILANFGNKVSLKYSIPQQIASSTLSENKGDLSVINQYASRTSSQNIKNPFAIPGLRKVVIDPQLSFDYTFESFVEGECNKLVKSAAMSVAANPGNTPFNPLFIYGNSGLGKTHIAQAVGIEVKRQFPEKNVLYVPSQKFQAQFQNASVKGEINDFMLFYQMIDVLIIDDIQELAGKPGTQNIFFNIFNHLHLSKKQIIMTADRPPVELKDIMERLITRFKWGLTVELAAPDYNTRVKIIQNKSKKQNIILTDEVTEYLATNIQSNVREIEGAIALFLAHSNLMGNKPSIELAKSILLPYVKVATKEITATLIVDTVTDYFNIAKDDFFASKRTGNVVLARQTAMYLTKQYTSMSLKAIGSAIGGKNHATVVHACKRIDDLISTDKNFKQQLDSLVQKLH